MEQRGLTGEKMELLPQISNRMSIYKYKKTQLTKGSLERILDAGRRAPSAKNRQPWRFIAVQDETIRKRLEKAAYGQEHVGQAPTIIAACTTNIDYRMPNGQLSYPIDLSFSVAFMMLQAEAENLGNCVITTYDEREVKEILSVPHSMRVVMLLLLGQPEERPFPAPRKSLKQIINYNHW